MHPPVLSKGDFVCRYAAKEFGNASPTWYNWQSWIDDNGCKHGDLFHIRNRTAGGKTWYDVPYYQLGEVWAEACREYGPEGLYISAMAPTEKTIFQGEIQRGLWSYDLTYSLLPRTMREALAEKAYYTQGTLASFLLNYFLCPRSHEWLLYLLDEYPEHVVEFSTYSVEWGSVPGFNTVFWEVRKY